MLSSLFPEVYPGTNVAEMGHGFDNIEEDYDSNDLMDGELIFGTVISNAECNRQYSSSPQLQFPYDSTLIDEELFCVEPDDDDSQICEVPTYFYLNIVNIITSSNIIL